LPGGSSRSIGVGSGCIGDNRWLSASRKIKGGKMIKVEVKVIDDRVEDVIISGDFFAYPAEAIEDMEKDMKGLSLVKLPEIVENYRSKVKLVGVTLDDLKTLIEELVHREL